MQDNTEPSHRSMEGVTTSEESIKEILYGTLLGDGYIFGNDRYTKRFGFFQSEEKKEYVEYLAKLLETRFKKINILKKNAKERWNAKIQYGFQIGDKYFNHLQKVFYKRKRKRVTQKILSSLTPLSLALWWMDDGTRDWRNRSMFFETQGFDRQGNERLQQCLKRNFRIRTSITSDGRNRGCRLYVPVEQARRLSRLISPWIVTSFRHKLTATPVTTEDESPRWLVSAQAEMNPGYQTLAPTKGG